MKNPEVHTSKAADGWGPDTRSVFALVPSKRRMGGGRFERNPEDGFWPELIRQARFGVSPSQQTVRAIWSHGQDGLVFGVSVDRELGRSAKRAAMWVWNGYKIVEWHAHPDATERTVLYQYLEPEFPKLSLRVPPPFPHYPMGRIRDVIDDHPDVSVQLRIDIRSVSSTGPKGLSTRRQGKADHMQHVRLLLRVSAIEPGSEERCRMVAIQIRRALNVFWSTDDNRFVVREGPRLGF